MTHSTLSAATAGRRTLSCGSFELSIADEGRGPAALVIGSSLYYPRSFSEHLKSRLRLISADHRGFARRIAPAAPGDFELAAVVDDMEAVRGALGLGRVIVIGHSGHALMALDYARRHGQAVSHLVLVAAGPSHAPEHMAAAEARWERLVAPARKARFEADMARLPQEIAADPDGRFVRFCLAMGARAFHDFTFDSAPLWQGVEVHMEAFDHLWGEAFRDYDTAGAAAEVEAPVLIVAGGSDYQVAPPWTWEPILPRFRDATLRVVEGAGHVPQLERPEAFDALLLDWLASRPA